MTHNHSTSQRIQNFIAEIKTLTGWTLTAQMVERGILFEHEDGSVFYPWDRISDGPLDSDGIAAVINRAVAEPSEN